MTALGIIASAQQGLPVFGDDAIRIDAINERYQVTLTGLGGGDVTVAAWMHLTVDRNTNSPWIMLDDGDGSPYVGLSTNSDGTTARYISTGPEVSGTAMTVGAWHYTALVYTQSSATANTIYISNGFGTLNATTGTGSDVLTSTWMLRLGGDVFGFWLNGRLGAVKVWGAALTSTELVAERNTHAPVRTAGLWATYPFDHGPSTVDASGNGHTLTAVGTPTTEAGPPI